ncbi:MAG: hypothetical protein HQK84_05745 [Nitrospinae bacterium]|nr:hypothetical protein [Nitrospinota bacterium]
MSLGVYVIEGKKGKLKELCKREGIPVTENPEDSTVIFAEDVGEDEAEWNLLRKLTGEGRTFISSHSTSAYLLLKLVPISSANRTITFEKGEETKRIWPFRVIKAIQPYDIMVSPYGKGKIVSLPFDISENLSNLENCSMYYPSLEGELLGLAPKVGKGEMRRLIVNYIKSAFLERGLPFIRLRHGPGKKINWFGFKVDVDEMSSDELRKIWNIAIEKNISISFFIAVRPNTELLPLLKEMQEQGQDIQLRCYETSSHFDYNRDREDLIKGIEALKSAGIFVKGVSASGGKWCFELSHLYEEFGLIYTSDINCSVNDLPFYPSHRGKTSKVIQVPVEAFSIELLVKSGLGEKEIKKLLPWIAKQHQKIAEPVFMSGYSGDRKYENYVEMYSEVMELFNATGYQNINLTDYADWWKKREKTQCVFNSFNNEELTVTVENSAAEQFLDVFLPDGSKRIVEAKSGTYRLDTLTEIVDEADFLEYGNAGKSLPSFTDKLKQKWGAFFGK